MAKISENIAAQMGQARKLLLLTKSDDTVYDPPLDGIYVGGTGNASIIAADDTAAVLLSAIPVGTFLPIKVKKLMSTNTTATLVVGFRNS